MLQLLRNAYGGLSRRIWLLGLVMLINRSGGMVISFYTVYLTQKLHFGITQTGIVMGVFGVGSILGAWLGGRLTDKIGYYPVQFWSLLLGGIMFIIVGQISTFYLLCFCTFFLSTFGEAYRPANTASIAHFSTPETFTRSVSLIRLAINLGFSIGPAIGGFLASRNYELLFWADGLTNIAAAGMVWLFLREKTIQQVDNQVVKEKINPKDSPRHDRIYLAFLFYATLYAMAFFQLFTVVPLFYKTVCKLSEIEIGLLLGLNGLLVAVFEMILIYKIEGRWKKLNFIAFGMILVSFSYLIFLFFHSYWWLVLGIVIASFSEMLAMPFMSSFAVERSKQHNRGQYSALYQMTWSVAQISAPLIGTQMIAQFGFNSLWYFLGGIGLVAGLGIKNLERKM
jgi:MFS family permease